MDQAQFSRQEIRIMKDIFNNNENIDDLAVKICDKIVNLLGIQRTSKQIKQYLLSVGKMDANQQEPMQERQKVQMNLFKSFSDNNRIGPSSSPLPGFNSLARPVPRRKNSVIFTSKRKMSRKQVTPVSKSNWTLQQRLDEIQRINEECTYSYDKYDKKTNKKVSFKQSNGGLSSNILWFYNEYFYSNYDRKYFQTSAMKELYNQIGFDKNPNQITLRVFKYLQQALPSPKRFNEQFIVGEKNKLEDFRNTCRLNTKNLSKNNESHTDFPMHSVVLALHPLCGHLHVGSIMAFYKQNLYMVRFHKPELPTTKILDISMSTQFISLASVSQPQNKSINTNINNIQKQNQQQQSMQSQLTQNINYEITGYLIKILAYKNQLIKLLKQINDECATIEKKENVAPSSEATSTNKNYQELFQWVVNIIKKLDVVIKQTLINFRLRGVNQSNQSTIFGNIKSLLMNPLKLMSKEFQNSNEQSDINAANQIKQIISKQRQNQIKKVMNNAILQANASINSQFNQSPNDGFNYSFGKKNRKRRQQDFGQENGDKAHRMEEKQPYDMKASEQHSRKNKNHNIIINQDPIEQKKIQPKMFQLVHSCLGVLADLKYEGKDFDYQKNPYLIKLGNISGSENSQAFNQVYERLFSIVSKVKE